MKKFICLTIALGFVCMGVLTGCNNSQEGSSGSAATNAPAAPAMPSTNAPATTNTPAQ